MPHNSVSHQLARINSAKRRAYRCLQSTDPQVRIFADYFRARTDEYIAEKLKTTTDTIDSRTQLANELVNALSPVYDEDMCLDDDSIIEVLVPQDDDYEPKCYVLYRDTPAAPLEMHILIIPTDGKYKTKLLRNYGEGETILVNILMNIKTDECVTFNTHRIRNQPSEKKDMKAKAKIEKQNILLPLAWAPNKNKNPNDLEDCKSPIHDYILEADDDRFIVRYHNRITGESDNNPDFKTIQEAKKWVQNTHAERKIGEWVRPIQSSIERCAEWFQVANPKPVLTNVVVQNGVHLEEMAEMLEALNEPEAAALVHKIAARYKAASADAMETMAEILNDEELTDKWADSMVDQIVTATGTLTNATINAETLLVRVNESNFSKFVDGKPVRVTENGKIMKGPHYFEPELSDYIEITGEELLKELATYPN